MLTYNTQHLTTCDAFWNITHLKFDAIYIRKCKHSHTLALVKQLHQINRNIVYAADHIIICYTLRKNTCSAPATISKVTTPRDSDSKREMHIYAEIVEELIAI